MENIGTYCNPEDFARNNFCYVTFTFVWINMLFLHTLSEKNGSLMDLQNDQRFDLEPCSI